MAKVTKKNRAAKKKTALQEQVAAEQTNPDVPAAQESDSTAAATENSAGTQTKEDALKAKKAEEESTQKNPPMLNTSGLKKAICI